MENSYIKKADAEYKKGKKSLETGLFQWDPDYNAAVSRFEEAAQLYASAKSWDNAIKAFEQADMCSTKLNDNWSRARNLEQIIQIQLEQQQNVDIDKLIANVKTAGFCFKAADSYQNSIKLFTKLIKYLLDKKQVEKAFNTAKEALEDAEDSGNVHNKSDIFAFYIEILIDADRYDEAIELYKKEISILQKQEKKTYIEQHILVIIILCLIKNDGVLAEKYLQSYSAEVECFFKSTESMAANNLLDYFQSGDQEQFDKISLKAPVSLIFPNNIVRKLRKLKVQKVLVVNEQPQDIAQQQIGMTQEQIEESKKQKEVEKQQELDKLIL